MPKRFSVTLPAVDQRKKILALVRLARSDDYGTLISWPRLQMLKDTKLAPGFSIDTLAQRTQGLSGSDLKEICRNAAMVPMREFMREANSDPVVLGQAQKEVNSLLVSSTCFC